MRGKLALATLAAVGLAYWTPAGTGLTIIPTVRPITVWENEDLSGDQYDLTTANVIVNPSAGTVCYANDRTGQDTRQLYTNCADFVSMGGVYGQ